MQLNDYGLSFDTVSDQKMVFLDSETKVITLSFRQELNCCRNSRPIFSGSIAANGIFKFYKMPYPNNYIEISENTTLLDLCKSFVTLAQKSNQIEYLRNKLIRVQTQIDDIVSFEKTISKLE